MYCRQSPARPRLESLSESVSRWALHHACCPCYLWTHVAEHVSVRYLSWLTWPRSSTRKFKTDLSLFLSKFPGRYLLVASLSHWYSRTSVCYFGSTNFKPEFCATLSTEVSSGWRPSQSKFSATLRPYPRSTSLSVASKESKFHLLWDCKAAVHNS